MSKYLRNTGARGGHESSPSHANPYSDAESVPERALHERELGARERQYLQPDDNELHAAGQVCERCGKVITASEDVRLLPDGHFVHEVCPVRDV
jgi:hypothetical protein